jgi:pimeloyl-ACP methyl ester carboxylesterase
LHLITDIFTIFTIIPMASSVPSAPHTPSESQTVTLPDGRVLGYATYGAEPSPSTRTIVYFHGFPTSRLEAAIIANIPLPIPIHILAIDRPGMGLSTFQPSRRILDWPSDVLAVVDHLNIEKFHITGDSGGSPYALVCAKMIPRTRLLNVAVVSGIYPLSLGTQGMLFGVKALLYGGLYLPQAVMMKVLDWEFGNAARDPDKGKFEMGFMKAMEKRAEKDLRCSDDLRFRAIAIESMREGFRQGSKGPAWDCTLYGDWGFDLKDVNGENIILWHGGKDMNAPFQMAEKAAKEMKGCE